MRPSNVTCVVIIVLMLTAVMPAQRMLLDQGYLNEFPAVDRIKAEVRGSDDVDTYARFVAAVSVINQFILNDLLRAQNGGYYRLPPAAERVNQRYANALTYYTIDHPEPARRDRRFP